MGKMYNKKKRNQIMSKYNFKSDNFYWDDDINLHSGH